jgi:ADP-heptose:LPS heptosyltransferase
VGIDSFIMHICAEMGKKGVVLFGNTYKPYALHNVGDLIPIIAEKNCTDKFPCHLPTCKMNKKCINNIKVEDVLEKLK